MTIYSMYDQVASLMATLDSTKLLTLKATAEMQGRFSLLVEKKHSNELSTSEKDELDHYIVLERLIRLAKLRTAAE
jgi:hypothetical protein